ncbi:transcriptional regulatory protein DesR [Jeotgalicoccus coquinae]|uniref:Transcriptional regulatory protein DegU n=1 Tax=Jeotgalicoccus coquinae TaxID=709509 RepID=A0A6V7R091_9STAP|nr:response regulator transcription factor [Jeotgalicoccus coquinae]MDO5359313.1 response regulator transcription factor [Jeotgalicoccus sp.]MBB6423772.1 two-component system response regulator DesR [Jeotgalicoccus coquinae]CAD2070740.1 Transcriptional regulatory protein DegU [Jeotgalicoccus coquinae]GGE22451.1 transcriptional regulatory protein DesR [Jeotgalicoccus coquinae]HBV22913.1 DNA-binding response regulator [Jeotgalicoccus sp.]
MIRIVLAEDQNLLLSALSSLLNLEEDISVVGMAGNGRDALKLVEEKQPDICLMDIEMPVMTGLDAAEELTETDCKVIILTTYARPGYFERAKKAQVSGYLLKDTPSETLTESIRQIMTGKRIYSPELIDIAFETGNPLTSREIEIIQLLADGKTTKSIAEELHLSNGTIRNYVSIVLDKLSVTNRIEAIRKALDKGWLK